MTLISKDIYKDLEGKWQFRARINLGTVTKNIRSVIGYKSYMEAREAFDSEVEFLVK